MKIKLLVALFLLLAQAVVAQHPYEEELDPLKGVLPPSPTASALASYSELPISLHTGVPSISIPLSGIKGRKLSLPLSLSYQGGGYQVDAISSWVGLGWSLNAGGVVTRTVQGIEDDKANGGYWSVAIQEDLNTGGVPVSVQEALEIEDYYHYLNNVAKKTWDSQPDQFNFNFSGYSGRFFIENNNGTLIPRLVPHQDIKIELQMDQGKLSTLTLTTPDGTIYTFGGVGANGVKAIEKTKTDNPNSCGRNYNLPVTTSWYLSSIESVDREEQMTFTYAENAISYVSSVSEQASKKQYPIGCDCCAQISPATNISGGGWDHKRCEQHLDVEGIYLEKIESISQYIVFQSDNSRSDLYGGRRLTNILYYDDQDNLLRSVDLVQDYFETTGGNASLDAFLNKRLRLTTVTEKDAAAVANPPYTLEYDPLELPARLSNAKDFWGFYNGQDGNATLIPAQLPDNPTFYPTGGDRFPNANYSKAGILTKINYPTGGHSTIEYESHELAYETPIEETIQKAKGVLAEYDYPTSGQQVVEGLFDIDQAQEVDINVKIYNKCGAPAAAVSYLKIEEKVNGSWQPLTTTNTNINQTGSGNDGKGTIRLGGIAPTDDIFSLYEDNFKLSLPTGEYKLIAGAMNSCPDPNSTATLNDRLDISVQYVEHTGNLIYNREVGGLRVKKTTLHDGMDASRDIIAEYSYIKKDSQQISSGYAPTPIDYLQRNTTFFPAYGDIINGCRANPSGSGTQPDLPGCICEQDVDQLFSGSQIPLHGLSGGHIAYTEVTQFSGLNGANGKTWNRFSQGENSSANGGGNLVVPQSLLDWRGGNLEEQIIYKKVSGNYVKVQAVKNDYQTSSTTGNGLGVFYGLAVNLKGHERDWINPDRVYIDCNSTNTSSGGVIQLSDGTTWYSPCYNQPPTSFVIDWPVFGRFNYVHYPIYYGWEKLTQSTLWQYEENGVDYVETITEYDYSDAYTHVLSTKVTNSDGTAYITESKYPTEYTVLSNPTSTDSRVLAIEKMQQLHQHAVPIEQIKYIQKQGDYKRVVGGIYTTFDINPDNTNVVNPVSIYRTELATPYPIYTSNFVSTAIDGNNNFFSKAFYELYGSYTSHNNKGLPLGFQRHKDLVNSFVWGYEDRAPILKATHAHHTELGYTSFEAGEDSQWYLQGTTNPVAGKVGTTALEVTGEYPVGQVFAVKGQYKTYKLSAWVKTGGSNFGNLVLRTCSRVNPANYPNVPSAYAQTSFSNTNGEWQLVEVELDVAQIRADAGLAANDLLDVHAYLWNPTLQTIEIDAVRFHPVEAFVETYDYEEATLLPIAMEGVNRIHSSYHYDDFQRLSHAKDFEGNILLANTYHYKNGGSLENHVSTKAVRVAGKTTLASLNGLPLAELTTSYQYVDGLGRGLQEVGQGQSPNGKDMVTFMDYDAFGRQHKTYLPYTNASSTGAFNSTPISQAQTFYGSTIAVESQSSYPYAETVFEASPLNRPLEQSSPGDGWELGTTHTTKYSYSHNKVYPVLQLDNASTTAAYYDPKTLTKTEITNTRGIKTVSYKDKLGRIVLSRQELDSSQWTNTYTLYNEFGNVKAVITPAAVELMEQSGNYNYTDAAYAEFIYTYTYDKRQRLSSKKIPNTAVLYYVYDQLDRPVATQDGNQRAQDQWLIQKYDVYSRPVLSALYSYSLGRFDLQNYFNQQASLYEEPTTGTVGYTNTLPVLAATDEVLSINYYDNYDFDRDGTIDANNNFVLATGYASSYFDRNLGQATGSKTLLLDGIGNYLKEVVFYDERGRVLQTKTDNHLGGRDISHNAYDFIGQLTQTQYVHNSNARGLATSISTEESFEYDHTGRLLKVYHQVDNDTPILLSQQHYDELGRLIQKQLHGNSSQTSFLQSIDYHYNIKDWLVRINDLQPIDYTGPTVVGGDDLFSMNFAYDYGGNISHLEWQVRGYDYRALYDYSYDQLNRLTNANYTEYLDASTPSNPQYQKQNHFSVNNITYDIMGNITHLQRRGTTGLIGNIPINGPLDDLTYTYTGNQLQAVEDAGSATKGFVNGASLAVEYSYDANGNVLTDANKGITVSYNHLNLPDDIQFTGGEQLEWLYTAGGQKLRKKATTASSTSTTKHYIGKVQYLDTNLEFINHPEGRIIPTITGYTVDNEPIYSYEYEYTLQDHLGNARVFFSDRDGNGSIEVSKVGGYNEVLQQEHYYPFGMGIRGEWKFVQPQIGGVNHYQYNGIELNDDFELDWNMAFYRSYDASIGRWGQVDPLAELFLSTSSYSGMANNPIILSDPLGLAPEVEKEKEKKKKESKSNWVPRVSKEGSIVLMKENGDNLGTLKAYFSGTNRFTEEQLEVAYSNAKAGIFVTLPEDNFSRAFSYARQNPEKFATLDGGDVYYKKDNYNCYHHCLNGVTNGEIYQRKLIYSFLSGKMNYSDYMIGIDDAYKILAHNFVKTSSNSLVYGQTVLALYPTLNQGQYVYQHFATYAGKDRKGNAYVLTKDGPRYTPTIRKLSDLMNDLPGSNVWKIDFYFPIQPINW